MFQAEFHQSHKKMICQQSASQPGAARRLHYITYMYHKSLPASIPAFMMLTLIPTNIRYTVPSSISITQPQANNEQTCCQLSLEGQFFLVFFLLQWHFKDQTLRNARQ